MRESEFYVAMRQCKAAKRIVEHNSNTTDVGFASFLVADSVVRLLHFIVKEHHVVGQMTDEGITALCGRAVAAEPDTLTADTVGLLETNSAQLEQYLRCMDTNANAFPTKGTFLSLVSVAESVLNDIFHQRTTLQLGKAKGV